MSTAVIDCAVCTPVLTTYFTVAAVTQSFPLFSAAYKMGSPLLQLSSITQSDHLHCNVLVSDSMSGTRPIGLTTGVMGIELGAGGCVEYVL